MMRGRIKRTLLSIILLFTLLSLQIYSEEGSLTSESGSAAVKGKIVVIVLDVSISIAPYFKTIQNVLHETVIKNRLFKNDYYVLIEFFGKANIVYSAQIYRDEDITTIADNMKRLKADRHYTDIGKSISLTLDQIIKLRAEAFDLYEPLVIYISDGDHEPMKDSPYYNMTIEEIFEDDFIGEKDLYHGWYIAGIGTGLKDLKKLAELTGREDYFINIENTEELAQALDEWINRIPTEPDKIEQGKVLLNAIYLNNKLLSEDKPAVIPLVDTYTMKLFFHSDLQTRTAKIEITDLSLIIQTDDMKYYEEIQPNKEIGRFTIDSSSFKESPGTFSLQDKALFHGDGNIKISIDYITDYYRKEKSDISYPVRFLTGSEIFWNNWGLVIIIVIVLSVIIILVFILKDFLPVAVIMEFSGSKQKRARAVSFPVGKSCEIGTKAGIPFRLDGGFPLVIARLKRSTQNKWEIQIKESACFPGTTGIRIEYTMGSYLKLVDKQEGTYQIRFIYKSPHMKKGTTTRIRGTDSSSKSTRTVRRRRNR